MIVLIASSTVLLATLDVTLTSAMVGAIFLKTSTTLAGHARRRPDSCAR
ncbi:MAG: hypothetical protein U0P48_13910 [Ancrocorticia sp.]